MDTQDRRRATERAVRLTMERRTELLDTARVIVGDHSLAGDIFQEGLVVAVEGGLELPDPDFGRGIREVVRRKLLNGDRRRAYFKASSNGFPSASNFSPRIRAIVGATLMLSVSGSRAPRRMPAPQAMNVA
jgi:hypothetical protein